MSSYTSLYVVRTENEEKTRLSPVLLQRGHGGVGAENAGRYELTTRAQDSHQYSYTGMSHRQNDSSIVAYIAQKVQDVCMRL